MPFAARVKDMTAHPGLVVAIKQVLIGGLPAAVAADIHTCAMPPSAGPHPPTPFIKGSATVLIGGRPALRMGDLSGCGAPIVTGATNVLIGG